MLKNTLKKSFLVMAACCGLTAFITFSGIALAQFQISVPAVVAVSSPEELDLVAVGIVKEIVASDQVKMQDGKIYSLDNIRVPVHYDTLATEYLKSILVGKEAGVFMPAAVKETRTDPLGNKIGHVLTSDGGWVQASLVTNGLAYAHSTIENRELIQALYAHEEAARKAHIGLWQNPLYSLKSRETIAQGIGSYQVFEDVIDDVRPRGEYISIVFGKKIPADFSALIKKSNESTFRNFLSSNIIGTRVRLHGWVENNNGPTMQLNYPEQLEMVYVEPPAKKENEEDQENTPCSEGDEVVRKACLEDLKASSATPPPVR